ncbi:MAG TPA: hypothetical protein VEH51_03575 [Burkholderiales bacterium]|nr:hypothetical protein [Burkholderiales bacterium]
MNFTAVEARKLALPLLVCLLLLGAGAALIAQVQSVLAHDNRELADAQRQRAESNQRLARIAEEEREVNEKLALYRRLKALHIIGPERRLEWADTMAHIRTSRELLDLRYQVERQQLLVSVPGKPANVDFYSSTMKVDLALLHEGDLLGFLKDLRDSGNAYYSIRRCDISRMGQAPTGTSIVPRLHASCDIDLITILDRAAKT